MHDASIKKTCLIRVTARRQHYSHLEPHLCLSVCLSFTVFPITFPSLSSCFRQVLFTTSFSLSSHSLTSSLAFVTMFDAPHVCLITFFLPTCCNFCHSLCLCRLAFGRMAQRWHYSNLFCHPALPLSSFPLCHSISSRSLFSAQAHYNYLHLLSDSTWLSLSLLLSVSVPIFAFPFISTLIALARTFYPSAPPPFTTRSHSQLLKY